MLSAEDRALLKKFYAFYRSLADGTRIPSTEHQRRFVAVVHGESQPMTPHEKAFMNLKHVLTTQSVTENELIAANFEIKGMSPEAEASAADVISEESLTKLTTRKRAILKLRTGCLPLTDAELSKVLPTSQSNALELRVRTLNEVADMFGVTRERIRQIEKKCLQKLGLEWNDQKTGLREISN